MPLLRRLRWYRGRGYFRLVRRRRLLRRLMFGTAIVLLLGGAATGYKLVQTDVAKIEGEVGKSTEEMTEEELKAAMKNLGIRKLELIEKTSIVCPNCGAHAQQGDQFCYYCGGALSSPLFSHENEEQNKLNSVN